MKEVFTNAKYTILRTVILDRAYYVVLILKMLTVSDFIDIAKILHSGGRNIKVKFRFAGAPKVKHAITKRPKPQIKQGQLTF